MRDKVMENWEAGYRCLDAKRYNSAASRFYYSIFQAVFWYAQKQCGYKYEKGTSRVHADMQTHIARDPMALPDYRRCFARFWALRVTADYQPDTPPENHIKNLLRDGVLVRDYYLKKAEQG